ncbi:AzlD domain-containing protein [Siminovitchia fortis]|uniref:AzlD domain-containing protein n=1 Tax=Siminovitchia fortis TaxID=254758 RepID=A0A443IQN9_9BACI|nr:AzlD domain-containing protein [Siminovitchia fortis]RWR09265.1 AzlD domain-containing protein [Siminovitchia fortis]WHY80875.1 AzlD domain-containing protein [Siminovitchia fortis]
MPNHWIIIILLAVSTFLSRIIGLEVMAGREMNPTLRLYFSYVPVAIMTALIINQVLTTSDGHLFVSFPVLLGCLAAVAVMKLSKMFLPSIIMGIVAGLLTRYFF